MKLIWMRTLLCLTLLINYLILGDIKKILKHKKEDMELNQIGTHLQVEVNIRAQESEGIKNFNTSSINMVERSPTHHGGNKQKGNYASTSQKGKSAKATKSDKEGCWTRGKLGHRKKNCYIYK